MQGRPSTRRSLAEGSGTGDAAAHAPQIPGKLPPDGEASQPLAGKAVGFDEPENGHIAKKEEVNAPSAKSGSRARTSVGAGATVDAVFDRQRHVVLLAGGERLSRLDCLGRPADFATPWRNSGRRRPHDLGISVGPTMPAG